MKSLLSLFIAGIMLCSCGDSKPDASKVKAKLEVIDLRISGNMRYGDIVIREIDSLYNVGENIRIEDRQFKIISKHN